MNDIARFGQNSNYVLVRGLRSTYDEVGRVMRRSKGRCTRPFGSTSVANTESPYISKNNEVTIRLAQTGRVSIWTDSNLRGPRIWEVYEVSEQKCNVKWVITTLHRSVGGIPTGWVIQVYMRSDRQWRCDEGV